jgi:hypothetical protein
MEQKDTGPLITGQAPNSYQKGGRGEGLGGGGRGPGGGGSSPTCVFELSHSSY